MIKQPNWAKDTHPTQEGWVNSKGELVKSQRITQQEIDEWYGANTKQMLHESPVEKPATITDSIKRHFWGE